MSLAFCRISAEGLADIRETVATCSSLSRSELALMIAEHLEWYSASGSLKLDACLKLLDKLEATEGTRIFSSINVVRQRCYFCSVVAENVRYR